MDNQLNQKLLENPHNEDDHQNEETISLSETFKSSLYLGCISFGGPVAHIGLFRQHLIHEKRLISEKKFVSLFTLSNILPGPTSSQLYTVISTIKSRSLLGGILSFIGFNFPSLLIVLLVSSIIRLARGYNFSDYFDSNFLRIMGGISTGLAQGALSIVIQAALTLGGKVADTWLQKSLLISSAIVYFLYNNYYNMMIIMAISGVVTLLFVYIFDFKDENKSNSSFDPAESIPSVPNTGLPLLILFVLTFISLIILNWMFDENLTLYLMDRFFRIGSLIFGGGHVVIPMILSEFTRKGLISEIEVINGFSLISLLPGPMFNIAGYVGTIINGVFSGLLSAISIFAPGIILVLGTFPFLNLLHKLTNLQIFLRGVSSASIGFIFSAALTLWLECCFFNKHTQWLLGTINVSMCYTILTMNYMAPVAIGFGAGFSLVLTLIGLI